MASWLKYLSREDIAEAKILAEGHVKSEVIEMVTVHVRKEMLFSGVFIPLACVFSFACACTLYIPGFWPGKLYGVFFDSIDVPPDSRDFARRRSILLL